MMQDCIRTSTYQRAMLENAVDFQDKFVLDVGDGSGIIIIYYAKSYSKYNTHKKNLLSFFAVQAGARALRV